MICYQRIWAKKNSHAKKKSGWQVIRILLLTIVFPVLLVVAGILYQERRGAGFLIVSLGAICVVGFWIALLFKDKWKLESRQFLILLFVGFFCSLILLSGIFYVLSLDVEWLSETKGHGVLQPANDPSPPIPKHCSPSAQKALKLYLGNGLAYTTSSSTAVIKVKDKTLLSIKRGEKGILVSAEIRSEDGQIVASLIDNEFIINPNNFFRRERPDRHTLTIYDQKNQRALYVRFLNKSFVKILCLLHYPGYAPFLIDEERVIVGPVSFPFFCGGNSPVVFDLSNLTPMSNP
jgi:hypothetical protein